MKVLIVDDDPDVVEYLSSFLEDQGYEVEAASDEAAALQGVKRFLPDVLLIDVMLPGKSGLDLMVCLRRDPRFARLPVVLVTGDDGVLRDECRSYLETHRDVAGPEFVLGKPVDRNALLDVLGSLKAPTVTSG